ncbi:MAG: hypothetical protein BGO63_03785 [Candidatus Accumulibacter sp. 66-26]|nr:MAG: hypothetical protein BGO63_03785 [Candidatus Accumulibacter sp. 66-26]
MKKTIIISTDMEGLTGISRWSQVTPTSPDYAEGCAALRHDLRVVLDVLEGQGYDLVVVDGHWTGTNLQPGDVGTATLMSGTRMPWGMVEQVQHHGVVGLILLGYHGCAGSGGAMAHTWDTVFTAVHIDGQLAGEITLATNLARQCAVPLLGVSGDDWACREARQIAGSKVPTAEVKQSRSYESVAHHSPEQADKALQAMAQQALELAATSSAGFRAPIGPKTTQEIVAKFSSHVGADRAALVPGTERLDALTLKYTDTPKASFDALRSWAMLADV